MQDIGHTLDWDDVFTQDGQEFIILEPGIYNFTVKEFKRGRFPGSPKIPACNKAELILEINSDKGPVSVKSDLIMFSSMEWKISSFLRSVGLKKHGETVKVKWDELVGKAYQECLRFTSPEVKKYIFMGHSPAVALLRLLTKVKS